MVWNNVYLPHESVLIFNCGPKPLLLDITYSHLPFPTSRTSMTFQGRLLVQEERRRRMKMALIRPMVQFRNNLADPDGTIRGVAPAPSQDLSQGFQ